MDSQDHREPVLISRSPALPQHVRSALAHLRDNWREKITLANLATHCGIPERTLLRQFKGFVGVSPLAYLLRLRLTAARFELLRGKVSISEVASQCGFTHFGRFASQYRKAFGEHPSATRMRDSGVSTTSDSSESTRSSPILREVPSLVIVPWRTETSAERYAAQELTEHVSVALSRMRVASVRFADPLSALPIKLTLARAVRDTTQYGLQGRLVQRGERVRVTLWLLDANNGRHIWGDSYDGRSDDLFELEHRVVEGVLGGVVPGITHAEINRSRDKVPESLAARDLMLRSLPTALRVDAASANLAFASATEAMQIDLGNALPVAMAAYSQARLWVCDGVVPEGRREVASRLAQRAGILDSGDPLVTTARAAVATLLLQPDDADALATRAVAMDPTCGWAWERRGFARLLIGDDPDAAINDFQRSLHLLGPYMPRDNYFIGIAHVHRAAGRLDEAIHWLRKGLAENPSAMVLERLLACWAWRLGDKSTSRQSVEAIRRAQPDLTVSGLIPLLPRADCPDVLKSAGLPL